MRYQALILSLVTLMQVATLGAAEPPRIAFKAGDRVVLLGSGLIEQERRFGYLGTRLGRPFPDPAPHNRYVARYVDEIQRIAKEHNVIFVDLFHPIETAKRDRPEVRLTTNGIQLNDAGSALVARVVEQQVALPGPKWKV